MQSLLSKRLETLTTHKRDTGQTHPRVHAVETCQLLGDGIPIGDRLVGPDEPPYLVAEMACAHEGQAARAMALTEAAERDWAFVMSGLSRGELWQHLWHALVARRPDKPNPRFYASVTLLNALQSLGCQRPDELVAELKAAQSHQAGPLSGDSVPKSGTSGSDVSTDHEVELCPDKGRVRQ